MDNNMDLEFKYVTEEDKRMNERIFNLLPLNSTQHQAVYESLIDEYNNAERDTVAEIKRDFR